MDLLCQFTPNNIKLLIANINSTRNYNLKSKFVYFLLNCWVRAIINWVFGGIYHERKECFMYCVLDKTASILLDTIQSCILPGTMTMLDCWKEYTSLKDDPNYIHLTWNHSMNFVVPETSAHMQTIKSTWWNTKMKNKSMFGNHHSRIDSYLFEFLWRRTKK